MGPSGSKATNYTIDLSQEKFLQYWLSSVQFQQSRETWHTGRRIWEGTLHNCYKKQTSVRKHTNLWLHYNHQHMLIVWLWKNKPVGNNTGRQHRSTILENNVFLEVLQVERPDNRGYMRQWWGWRWFRNSSRSEKETEMSLYQTGLWLFPGKCQKWSHL